MQKSVVMHAGKQVIKGIYDTCIISTLHKMDSSMWSALRVRTVNGRKLWITEMQE